MTYVIAISNEKGGVAKTTTTISLGASLAENNKNVLLIDLDPQGNLTLASGLDPKNVKRTVGDVLLENMPIIETIHKTETENLEIIPANNDMDQADEFLPVRLNYALTLKEAIQQALPIPYDYILMDCPPALGAVTLNALSAADLLVIPTQAEFFSAYALRDMMGLIRRVRQEYNPKLSYRILITLLDQRNRAHRVIRDQLQQTFGAGLFDTIIEIDTRLRESPIAGVPIIHYRPNSRGSLQYRVLAQELIKYVEEKDTQAT